MCITYSCPICKCGVLSAWLTFDTETSICDIKNSEILVDNLKIYLHVVVRVEHDHIPTHRKKNYTPMRIIDFIEL